MRRFYRLDMQPDLFSGVLLVKAWGRIAERGFTSERLETSDLLEARYASPHFELIPQVWFHPASSRQGFEVRLTRRLKTSLNAIAEFKKAIDVHFVGPLLHFLLSKEQ